MKNMSEQTSVVELFRNGMVNTRVMNSCRRMGIYSIGDILDIEERYGSLHKKFGPTKMAHTLQGVLDSYSRYQRSKMRLIFSGKQIA